MDDALLTLLRSVDTPTVCNAIETAEGKRGFNRFTRGAVLASAPSHRAMVGYARTARISAIAPSTDPAEVVRERRLGYYRHMSEGPRPAVAVVEDVDGADAIGAYWGEVNTTVHKALGLDGALTNGLMRDLGDLPDGFPVLAGSVGPSHGFVHVVDYAAGARVFGMDVVDGDLLHGDRHGALVIPPAVIPDLAAAIETLFRAEACILEPARKGPMTYAEFEEAWAAFEAART
jgi:regulator of RNase E activity RraA|tara:strand:+ start:4762 stop:5457 length:696 start_codon:yes stop_codon:yes gene_type:complete